MKGSYRNVLETVLQACNEYQRNDVSILAVSKKKSVDDILEVYQQGQRIFAENYVQEALEKIEALKRYDITWHFIGAIQSNKTKNIAEHFDWVQSVDREKIAKRLSEQRPKDKAPLNVLIQVNVDEDENKSGLKLDRVESLVATIQTLPNLICRGLMILPQKSNDFDAQCASFEKAKALFDELNQKGFELDVLSMGMSGDLRAAIKSGSTMVRIGTAIFGVRG